MMTPEEVVAYQGTRFYLFLVADAVKREREACAGALDAKQSVAWLKNDLERAIWKTAMLEGAATIRARSVLTYPPDAAAPRSPGAARGISEPHP